MAKHKKYYKGEGGGFPHVWVMVNLVSLCMHMFLHAPKVLQPRTNQLIAWFV
jgi:hypothetical protein